MRFLKNLIRPRAERGATFLSERLGMSASWEDLLMLQGRQLALMTAAIPRIGALHEIEFKVFSQFGEDGIIEWLVSRLPRIPQTFVEFGTGNYLESNTRFLLQNRNWRGLIMDGSESAMASVRRHRMHWQYDVTPATHFITRENINNLLTQHGFVDEIGLLSIDIDGNDYWVWEAINVVSPWIVIIEYNTMLGDVRPITIPYDPNFNLISAHPTHRWFGAAVKAHELLGGIKGYVMLGSNGAGNNAFFLRKDVASELMEAVKNRRARPSRFRLVKNSDGTLNNTGGTQRSRSIENCEVVDVSTGRRTLLGSPEEIYSSGWKSILG